MQPQKEATLTDVVQQLSMLNNRIVALTEQQRDLSFDQVRAVKSTNTNNVYARA